MTSGPVPIELGMALNDTGGKSRMIRKQLRDKVVFLPCLLAIAGLFTLLCNARVMAENGGATQQSGGSSTAVDYRDVDGNRGKFSDHRGRWIVINYWAIWCAPCIKEIPEFNELSERRRDDVAVFGVDFDQSAEAELKKHIDKLNIQFPVLIDDPAALLGLPAPRTLPVTYIINPAGELTRTLSGPQTLASLERALQ